MSDMDFAAAEALFNDDDEDGAPAKPAPAPKAQPAPVPSADAATAGGGSAGGDERTAPGGDAGALDAGLAEDVQAEPSTVVSTSESAGEERPRLAQIHAAPLSDEEEQRRCRACEKGDCALM